jgi:hypothetical protein
MSLLVVRGWNKNSCTVLHVGASNKNLRRLGKALALSRSIGQWEARS